MVSLQSTPRIGKGEKARWKGRSGGGSKASETAGWLARLGWLAGWLAGYLFTYSTVNSRSTPRSTHGQLNGQLNGQLDTF